MIKDWGASQGSHEGSVGQYASKVSTTHATSLPFKDRVAKL